METVLITGGSGLIGSRLKIRLNELGYRVITFSRQPLEEDAYLWNPATRFLNVEALKQADHILHLAGASIGMKRWSVDYKRLLVESRVETANMLYDEISKLERKPKTFITASGTGFYGYGLKTFTEDSNPGEGFLPDLCVQWESITSKMELLGIRTASIRTGLVLSLDGGVLPLFMLPMRLGFGLPLGKGNQPISWIHIDDLCEIYAQALSNTRFSGPINAVSPEILTNKTFVKALSLQMRKPMWNFPVPACFLKLLMGERSELVLKGTHAVPEKLKNLSYTFKYPEIGSALESLIKQL